MKILTIYEAEDGTRFDDEIQCLAHDELIVACQEAMSPLAPEYEIGGGYFRQHDRESALQAKRNMLAIVRRKFEWFMKDVKSRDDEINPSSIIGRVIDDGGYKPIRRAWGRLGRINWQNFREYEQVCYAMHPGLATKEIGT